MSSTIDQASTLHASAIQLLRTVRADDPRSGLSPARLSALSVVIYAGPLSLSELARLEQASRPGMSQLVSALEKDGLVRRSADPEDGRAVLIQATRAGKRRLEAARRRRLERLTALLEKMSPADRAALDQGLAGLARAFSVPSGTG